MGEGSGESLIGGENSSGAGPLCAGSLGTGALGDGAGGAFGGASADTGGLSHCSASPEDTVQNFLEQVSSSYSSESLLLFGKICNVLENSIKSFPCIITFNANFEIPK